jgi:hypothetical protein
MVKGCCSKDLSGFIIAFQVQTLTQDKAFAAGGSKLYSQLISKHYSKCTSKCYFLLAEERKRQKMFFSHTAGGLGQGWGQGHQSHFFACLVQA